MSALRTLALLSALLGASVVIAQGPPAYQPIGTAPQGDRFAAEQDGRALFHARCGACHLPWGMGSNMLTAQRAAQGLPPESGLLENRDDLDSDYIQSVVRHGRVAMPPLTRVQVTDAELVAIAAYLAKEQAP